ncbi:activin receptor type-1C isoform X2 [Denticeps clupeoides]|uniref:Snake toxin/toxin-like domain-containing protein n=1 Tax=Denticeps clupeoides TaxID=299321 RepID=A0AAY4AGY6_9TELE|nr:activin receptor type-1C-like isoform X2 [Denticeps clupeoides]
MKVLLVALLLLSIAANTRALKCHTCVAPNMEDCNRQGSMMCPQSTDACSTITGPGTVVKSCSHKAFCDKVHLSNSGVKTECCFSDDCNGPHHAHSHSDHHNGAGAVASSASLLLGALAFRMAIGVL